MLEPSDLYVQQAAITGESLPSEKEVHPKDKAAAEGTESPRSSFLGTSVVSGTGTAEVFATGARTAFGAIAERLAARPDETEFERTMKRFGLLITRVVFFLAQQ